jgi:hypothetical protein
MSAYLYRLFDVQTFDGQKIAIYSCEGNFPHAQILSDAQELVDGNRTRTEVVKDSFYDMKATYPDDGRLNRERLTYYARILRRSQKVLDENGNVDKAIFVNSTYGKDWRGERTLYENKLFDTVKCDTPEFTGCTPNGTITL